MDPFTVPEDRGLCLNLKEVALRAGVPLTTVHHWTCYGITTRQGRDRLRTVLRTAPFGKERLTTSAELERFLEQLKVRIRTYRRAR